jgi:hypothetical protein
VTVVLRRQVQEIARDVQKLASQTLTAHLLNAEDTTEQIDACIRLLSWLVNDLIVGAVHLGAL